MSIAIPIDLRRNAALPPAVANRFIGTGADLAPAAHDGVWGLAAEAAAQIHPARDGLAARVARRSNTGPATAVTAQESLAEGLIAELQLSNLGVVERMDGDRFAVTELRGAILRDGIRDKLVLGVTTYGGVMRIVLQSPDENRTLLDRMVAALTDAAAAA